MGRLRDYWGAVPHANTRQLRRWARRIVDTFASTCEAGVLPFGKEGLWHVDSSRLPPGASVVSGGVGKDVSAELELVAFCGATVLLFDPSPTGVETMRKAANQSPLITFEPTGLAGRAGPVAFSSPINPAEGSFGHELLSGAPVMFRCRRVGEIMESNGLARLDLLKLDIEGFEYEVLADVTESKLPIEQICVEFHHFLPGFSWRDTLRALDGLFRAGYRIVHKRGTDFTFVRAR